MYILPSEYTDILDNDTLLFIMRDTKPKTEHYTPHTTKYIIITMVIT